MSYDADLKGYWKLNSETAGVWPDSTDNANDVTETDGGGSMSGPYAIPVSGKVGNACQILASDMDWEHNPTWLKIDSASAGDFDFTGDFTLRVVYKPGASMAGGAWLMGKAGGDAGDGIELYTFGYATFRVHSGSGWQDVQYNGSSMQAGTVYDIVAVFDKTNEEMRVYVNTSKASKGIEGLVCKDVSGADFTIGATENHTGCLFAEYDECFACARALTDADVAVLYNGGDMDGAETLFAGAEPLSVSVYDEVHVTGIIPVETIGVTDFPSFSGQSYTDMYDSVSITEDVVTSLDVLNILVYDEIAVAEDNPLSKIYLLSVYDEVSITEDITASLDVLNTLVYDEVSIAESVSVLDIVVEVGPIVENISITEDIAAYLDVLNTLVYDEVSITESISAVLDVLWVSVYDSVSITEAATSSIAIGTSVYDSVSITESVALDIPCGVEVYEEVSIAEDISLSLDILNTLVYDSISITEYVSLLDLVVELSIYDEVSITESVVASLDVLNLLVYDEVSITEDTSVSIDVLNVNVYELIDVKESWSDPRIYDSITVTEDVSVVLDALVVDEYDSVSITEDVALLLDTLNTSVYDSVSIAESISVHDIVVEVGPIVETISIAEEVVAALDNLYVSEEDSILITENVVASLAEVNVLAYDEISVVEDVNVSPELSIEVYEEVTVAENISLAKAHINMFLFKVKNSNNTEAITVNWSGKTSRAPSTDTVYMEIYNYDSSEWEALVSNDSEGSDTDFVLNATVSEDVADYYDADLQAAVRVYQEVSV